MAGFGLFVAAIVLVVTATIPIVAGVLGFIFLGPLIATAIGALNMVLIAPMCWLAARLDSSYTEAWNSNVEW